MVCVAIVARLDPAQSRFRLAVINDFVIFSQFFTYTVSARLLDPLAYKIRPPIRYNKSILNDQEKDSKMPDFIQ